MNERHKINRDQKAWKFIRDVNTTSLCDLNRTAMDDGSKTYTYGMMFREWERYASVFSAIGMTGENCSRVGVLGSTCAEALFAIYGLNMVGADISVVPAYSALFPKKIIDTVRREKLTDFIITDDFAQANVVNELLVRRDELCLKNVIVLHAPVKGPTVNLILTAIQELKYRYLKGLYGPVCMDELLAAYGNHPVAYASGTSSDTAFILHTSGTTSGAGKPVALSDQAFNEAVSAFYEMEELDLQTENLVTSVIVDLSNAYGIIDQVHLPFAMGAEVVVTPGGILNPWFYRSISKSGITCLFSISAMFERWMKLPEGAGMDFSSLRMVVLGGAAVSAADKRRYYAFLQKHGAGDIKLLNGYGISELGGACCLSTADLDDESIGYPLPGVRIRIFDEESGVFLPPGETPCEGILYLYAPSVATRELDGAEILSVEYAEGLPYICTNDLVRVEEDGRITFLGRANRYFINDDGRKYESGRVETEFSRHPDIESCCIAPVYVKTTHDNIPMLCAKPMAGEGNPRDVIRKALRDIFVTWKTLGAESLPCRVMIAEELPRNANGKIDLFKIGRGEVEGDVFTIKTIRVHGEITDFRLESYEEGPADMIQEVFDGISAELENSMPFNRDKSNNTTREDQEMKTPKSAFEAWNSMNQMGMQMMKNMMVKTGMNKVPFFDGGSFCKMPDMNKQMTQAMACMEEMNRTALDMMQKMYDQNCKMMNQFMDMMKNMTPATETAEEKDNDAESTEAKAESKAEATAVTAEDAESTAAEQAESKDQDEAPAETKKPAPKKKAAGTKSKKTTEEDPADEKKEK